MAESKPKWTEVDLEAEAKAVEDIAEGEVVEDRADRPARPFLRFLTPDDSPRDALREVDYLRVELRAFVFQLAFSLLVLWFVLGNRYEEQE